MEEINLPLPFISQEDPQANEDAADNCGPTCICMILVYYGEKVTVNEVFEKTGAVKGQLITIAQLQTAITSYGFTSEFKTGCTTQDILDLLKKNIAPIALVHYENLSSREDQNYKGAHFILIDGMRDDGIFANDPDFFAQFRQDGDHHFYTMTDFQKAWGDCHLDNNPDNSILVIYPKAGAIAEASQDTSVTAQNAPTTSLQDEYDHIQHLLLDLAAMAGADSIADRDAMIEQAKENIQKLKSLTASDTQTLLDLKGEGGKKDETILQLLEEVRATKAKNQVLADLVSQTEKADSTSLDVGIAAQRELNDLKTAQKDVASFVKAPKNSWWHITRAIEAMKTGYEITISELKKQNEKLKPSATPTPAPQDETKKKEPGFWLWFDW